MRIEVAPRRRLTEVTTVTLVEQKDLNRFAVFNGGKMIGYVWKATRTSSPPVSKGSRIARHHRRITCWRNDLRRIPYDTRLDALAELIVMDLETQ